MPVRKGLKLQTPSHIPKSLGSCIFKEEKFVVRAITSLLAWSALRY